MANVVGGNNAPQNNPLYLKSIVSTDNQRPVGNLKVAVANLEQVPRRPNDEGPVARQSFREKFGDNALSRAFGGLRDRIMNAWHERGLKALENSPDKTKLGGSGKLPSSGELFAALEKHGTAGARHLAIKLLGPDYEKRDSAGPLDLSNAKDHKIVVTIMKKLLGSAMADVEREGIGKGLENVNKLIQILETAQRPPSEMVGHLLDVAKLVRGILMNDDKAKAYAGELIKDSFMDLAKEGPATFMRASSDLSRVVVNIGYDAIRDGGVAIKQDLAEFFPNHKDDYDASTKAPPELPSGPLAKDEKVLANHKRRVEEYTKQANARVEKRYELADKMYDQLYGADGGRIVRRLGDEGKAHLREMGLKVIEASLRNGATPEQANANAKQYYQNVLFLKGASAQVTHLWNGTDYHTMAVKLGQIIQDVANGKRSYDKGKTDYEPHADHCVQNSPIIGKMAQLYETLDLPTTDDLDPELRRVLIPQNPGNVQPGIQHQQENNIVIEERGDDTVERGREVKTEPKSERIDYDDFINGFKEQISLMKGYANSENRLLTRDEQEIIEAFETGIQTMEARKRGEDVDVGVSVDQFSTQIDLIEDRAKKEGRDLTENEKEIVSQFQRGIDALLDEKGVKNTSVKVDDVPTDEELRDIIDDHEKWVEEMRSEDPGFIPSDVSGRSKEKTGQDDTITTIPERRLTVKDLQTSSKERLAEKENVDQEPTDEELESMLQEEEKYVAERRKEDPGFVPDYGIGKNETKTGQDDTIPDERRTVRNVQTSETPPEERLAEKEDKVESEDGHQSRVTNLKLSTKSEISEIDEEDDESDEIDLQFEINTRYGEIEDILKNRPAKDLSEEEKNTIEKLKNEIRVLEEDLKLGN